VDTWDTSPQPTEGLQRLWTGAGRSLLSDAAGALGRVLWEEDLWAVDSHATPWEEQEPDISAILAALPVRWTAKGGSGLDLGADGLAALHTLGRNLRLDTDPLAVAAHLLGAADGSDAAAVFRLAGAGQWRLDAAKGWEAPTELSESPGSLLGEAVRTGRPGGTALRIRFKAACSASRPGGSRYQRLAPDVASASSAITARRGDTVPLRRRRKPSTSATTTNRSALVGAVIGSIACGARAGLWSLGASLSVSMMLLGGHRCGLAAGHPGPRRRLAGEAEAVTSPGGRRR
jgi:hypothetical protein